MTISSTTVKNSYNGDGSTTTFSYTFKIFANSDLQVIIRNNTTATETVKTLTTHYTVTGAGSASGGSVIFTAGNIPASGETVVLRRAVPQTQAIDYIANDPFPAESHEEGLDRAMMTLQQVQEEVTRSIKLSRTNTMTSTEFTVGSSDRANKVLAFDSSGEIAVTQEIGTFRGNWSASVSYQQRDLIKDTTNNNIYIANTAHTSSGSLPISSNADSAKWNLIVDAASATASASAAATSATNAANSATASANSASTAATSESNAATSESNASTSATNAANSATSASNSATTATTQATAAAGSATSAASSASTATTQATNAANSATSASGSATTATTQAGIATTQASNASTSASNAATSESNAASSASTATTQATNASNSATAAAASAAAAAASADNFDDVYLGAKASDPSTDNDGDPLNAGDLYYNTSAGNLKYYDGSVWIAVTSGGITDVVQDGSPQLGGMLDVNGQAIGDGTLELVKFAETASAVNEITVTNAATTTAPEIAATGDDTNIDLKLTPKGSGNLVLDGIKFPNADGTADQVLKTDGSGNLSFATLTSDGTADWDTTVKTTGFTATVNKGYFLNTTSAGFTVTLPASPSAGDEVILVDYAGTFATNNLVITSTLKINSSDNDVKLTTDREATRLVYIDSTQGWLAYSGVNEGTSPSLTDNPPIYSVDFLVVAGGAAGGQSDTSSGGGGGGGAGGFRTSTQTVLVGTVITVTVGDGGASGNNSGSNSSISGSGLTTITSAGGGNGGGTGNATAGGSGGGGSSSNTTGASGNTPSTSPSQGNSGGNGFQSGNVYAGGGGGGSGATGGTGSTDLGGSGGNGTASSITGSSVTYAGGGGGGVRNSVGSPTTGGSGGTGGGGRGAQETGSTAAVAGTANTGGGGGGNHAYNASASGAGGKGVVILSVPTASYSGTSSGSPTITTSGSNTILQFNGSGSYTA